MDSNSITPELKEKISNELFLKFRKKALRVSLRTLQKEKLSYTSKSSDNNIQTEKQPTRKYKSRLTVMRLHIRRCLS
jgi:hypothetical protein